MKAVVVVVLSWNHRQAVVECLDRANALTGARIEVVVVDNASSDGSVAAIRAAHPDATVLEQPVNLGFAGGVNRGLAEAAQRGADFAWLLNDDTLFDPSVLEPLLAHAEAHPDCGLLSPLLVDLGPEAGDQFRNGLIDWTRGEMRHNLPADRYAARIDEGATPTVPGTALLCDLRVYRAIGGFDERFFAYWEDTDYAMRAVRAGFTVAVVPAAVLRHAATASRHDRPPHYHYYMVRNDALFWRLHDRSARPRWRRRWLDASLESIAENRDLGRDGNVDAIVDGLWHAWRRRYGPRAAHAPAPRWMRTLLAARPYLWLSFVRGDLSTIVRRALGRG